MSALVHLFGFLSPRDRCVAALVAKEWHQAAEHPSLWNRLDLQGRQDARAVLLSDLRAPSFHKHLRHVILEFAKGVDDLTIAPLSCCSLLTLNLNACQRVTESGLAPILVASSALESLQLYWNLPGIATSVAICSQYRHAC